MDNQLVFAWRFPESLRVLGKRHEIGRLRNKLLKPMRHDIKLRFLDW
jgi:hypothetical protein